MTLRIRLRPVLVCLALLGGGFATASCGMSESDPRKFENMARGVAEIPLDGSAEEPTPTHAAPGLRPALPVSTDGRLKVEVMDPHALWDARDAGMRGAIEQVGSRVTEIAAPAVADAVVQRVSARIADVPLMRPGSALSPSPSEDRTTIQLGAYSSPEAARAAWADVSTGAARNALKGLAPVFETVQVDGRPFTRLKVAAPVASAAAICRAAEVSDPWCARQV